MIVPRPTAQLRSRLLAVISARQPAALIALLSSLRNAEFRAAGSVLTESATWRELTDVEFWHCFTALVQHSAKAFLGTMLKAVVQRHQERAMRFDDAQFVAFATQSATEIDAKKVLETLLPLQETPQAVDAIQRLFERYLNTPVARAALFFRIATPPTYYLLFAVLKEKEDDKAFIRRYAVELMRRGDKLSYNLAGILRAYFDLEALPGTFSLALPPYELSRLDKGYEAFFSILSR